MYSNRPNILMIAVDDLNDFVGAMGNPDAITPNMDKLASQGVLFTRTQCPAPLCGPSRASIMTGLRPSSTGIYGMIDDNKIKNANAKTQANIFLHQYFKNAGYYIMGVGKIFHHHAPEGLFDESGGASGYGPFPKQRMQWKKKGTDTDWGAFPQSEEEMPDDTAVNWAIKQLERNYDKPFFLNIGFYRPHVPWYVPKKWYDLYDTTKLHLPAYLPNDRDDLPSITTKSDDWPQMPSTEWAISNNQWKNILQAYLACVSYTDHNVGRVLEALSKSPYANNTIVVLWGDNGYRLGEKNTFAKVALWERATKVPFIFSGPGIPKNKKVSLPVELLSLYPTLTDLCGLLPNKQNESKSLFPLIKGSSPNWTQPALTTWGRNNHAIRTSAYTYIRYEDGSEELYDVKNDPNEWQNLAANKKFDKIKSKLKKYLPVINVPWADDSFYNANTYFTEQKKREGTDSSKSVSGTNKAFNKNSF